MEEKKSFRSFLEKNRLLPESKDNSGTYSVTDYIRVVNRWAHFIVLIIAEIALACMIAIVTFNVVLRYCFATGIKWVEEVPGLLVTLFAFIALAMGVRDHLHVSVNVVANLFPKDGKARKVLLYFGDLCVFFCGLFLLIYGAQYVSKLMRVQGTLPMTGLRTYIQYLPAPLAGFIISFDSLLFLTGVLKPEDLLYSEPEIDYTEQVIHVSKENR